MKLTAPSAFRLTAAPLALAALIATSLPACAEEASEPPRTISVSGTAEVTGRPDTASVTTGVVSEAKTAREALDANNEAMTSVMDGLKAAGIAEKDIQTSQFSVSPRYNRPPKGEEARIVGYTVSNQVTVIVRDLDDLGATLDKLVSLGSNRINGISFMIDHPEPLMDQAREQAVKNALGKAKLLTGAAGVTLGQILTINESGGYVPRPVYARAEMAMAADMAVPVAPGEQTITATVNISFEIE